MKIYKFKAYSKAKGGVQDRLITRFGLVRNYAVKMMETYYRLYGKTLTAYELSNHIARKKRRNCRTAKMDEVFFRLEGADDELKKEIGFYAAAMDLAATQTGALKAHFQQRSFRSRTLSTTSLPTSSTAKTSPRSASWWSKECFNERFQT